MATSPSPQFKRLLSRLAQLKKTFLSLPPDSPGHYSEEAKDYARSYRVLTHAEIESFVRLRVDEIVKHTIKLWREKKVPHRIVVSMLACWNKNWNTDAKDEIPFPNKDKKGNEVLSVDSLVNRAFKAYQDNMDRIYGIKPTDLEDFLMPLGIHINTADFGTTWLADMENFGIQRGRVAHSGEAGSRDISPDDEQHRMESLLPGLEKLDEKLTDLLQK